MADLELDSGRAVGRRRLADLRDKRDRGVLLDADELREAITLQGFELWNTILDGMTAKRSDPERRNPVAYTQGTADGIRLALTELLKEITAAQIVSSESDRALRDRIAKLEKHVDKHSSQLSLTRSQRLENRIAALEAAAKPHQRVKAATRRST